HQNSRSTAPHVNGSFAVFENLRHTLLDCLVNSRIVWYAPGRALDVTMNAPKTYDVQWTRDATRSKPGIPLRTSFDKEPEMEAYIETTFPGVLFGPWTRFTGDRVRTVRLESTLLAMIIEGTQPSEPAKRTQ